MKFSDLLSAAWEKSLKNEVNIFVSKHDEVLQNILISKNFKLVNWVITEIVKQTDLKKRIATLKIFIKTCDKLYREIKNFDGAFVIVEALCAPAVVRLSKTWEANIL